MRSYNLAIQHPMCEEMLNYIFSSNINVDLYDMMLDVKENTLAALIKETHHYLNIINKKNAS